MSLIPLGTLKLARLPPSFAVTLAALPSISETHFLDSSDGNEGSRFDARRLGLVGDQLAQEKNL